MTKRSYDEIFADLDKVHDEREKLDSEYHEKSEELTTRHEQLLAELKD